MEGKLKGERAFQNCVSTLTQHKRRSGQKTRYWPGVLYNLENCGYAEVINNRRYISYLDFNCAIARKSLRSTLVERKDTQRQ